MDELLVKSSDIENITTKYLTFLLGEEHYAINLCFIQEIAQNIEKIIKIQNSPDYILGVIKMHDGVIPLIDLRIFYKLSIQTNQQPYVVMIININDDLYGIIVDGILDIIDINQQTLKPLNLSTIVPHYYIEGLAVIENVAFIIFNIKNFIHHEVTHIKTT